MHAAPVRHPVQRLAAPYAQLHIGGKQRPKRLAAGKQQRPVRQGGGDGGDVAAAVQAERQIGRPGLDHPLRKIGRAGFGPHRPGRLPRRFRRGAAARRLPRGCRVDAPSLHHLEHLKPCEQRGRLCLVDRRAPVSLGRSVDGRVAADFTELSARIGHPFALAELLAHARLDFKRVELCINRIDIVVLPDQRQRRLFTDPGDTRDIVGRIAHQRLDVDKLRRFNAILFTNRSLIIQR